MKKPKQSGRFSDRPKKVQLLEDLNVADIRKYEEEKNSCFEFFSEKGLKTVVFLCDLFGDNVFHSSCSQTRDDVSVVRITKKKKSNGGSPSLRTVFPGSFTHPDTKIWMQRARLGVCYWDSMQVFLHEEVVKRINREYDKAMIRLDGLDYGEFILSPITDDVYRKLCAASSLLVDHFFDSLEFNLAFLEDRGDLNQEIWFFSRELSGILQEKEGRYTLLIPEDNTLEPNYVAPKEVSIYEDFFSKQDHKVEVRVIDRKEYGQKMERAYLRSLLGEEREERRMSMLRPGEKLPWKRN